MENSVVERLLYLAQALENDSRELAGLLRMPHDENQTGDLSELETPIWIEEANQDIANLAFTMIRVQGIIESVSGRINGKSGVAGVSKPAHSLNASAAG